MPLYLCKWADGSSSIVKAKDKNDACEILDEVGDPTDRKIVRLKSLLLTLRPTESGEFDVEYIGGDFMDELRKNYPALDKAWGKVVENDIKVPSNEAKRIFGEAIKKEREKPAIKG